MRRTPPNTRTFLVLAGLACALSLGVGTALAQLAFPSQAVAPVQGDDTPAARLVTRFYAAVNNALQTGDVAALDDLVAVDFAEHPARPGVPPGRDGFVAVLASLRATFPFLRLTVEDVRAAGDLVVARVRLEGATGTFLGRPLGGAHVPWGPLDLFRVADGRVVEHWGVPANAAHFDVVTQAPLTLPVAGQWRMTLNRRDYTADARWAEVADGPLVLLGRSGTVAVSVERAAPTDAVLVHTAAPGQRRGSGETIRAGDVAILVPGDLFVIPQGARFATRSYDSLPASVLVLELDQPAYPGGAPADSPTLPIGIEAQPLVWGPAANVPDDVIVLMGRVTLGPGGEVPMHRTDGPELVLIESGAILVSTAETPAWVRHGPDGWSRPEAISTLAAGDGALVPPGTVAGYRNPNETSPVSALVFTILPANAE